MTEQLEQHRVAQTTRHAVTLTCTIWACRHTAQYSQDPRCIWHLPSFAVHLAKGLAL